MANPKQNPSRKYASLEKLSTERLEELLILASDTLCGQEDEAYTDAIVEVILKREQAHPTGRLSDVDEAWEEFQTYFNVPEGDGLSLYFEDEGESTEPEPIPLKPVPKRHRLRRILIAAAIIAALAVLAVPPAFGYVNIFEMIGQWTDSTFQFAPSGGAAVAPQTVNGDIENLVTGEYPDIQSALDACRITESIIPTWLPAGMELGRVEVYLYADAKSIALSIFFDDIDSNTLSMLIIQHQESSINNYLYEKDVAPVIEHLAGNNIHYIMENNGQYTATWFTGFLECSMSTNISQDVLITMINSIYEE